MSVTLKTSKPRMYCTYWDVISYIQEISTDNIDISGGSSTSPIRRANEVENIITRVDNYIRGKLLPYYSDSSLRVTPWTTIPVADKDNDSSTQLIAVSTGAAIATAYTAAFILTIQSTTTSYTFNSSLEGDLGVGTIACDSSDDYDLVTIGTNAWNATTASEGDKFYFSIVDCEPIIHDISIKLSAAEVMESIFTGESPNTSAQGEQLRKQGELMLNRLADPESDRGIRLSGLTEKNLDSIPIDYHITDEGADDSSYSEDQPTRSGIGVDF